MFILFTLTNSLQAQHKDYGLIKKNTVSDVDLLNDPNYYYTRILVAGDILQEEPHIKAAYNKDSNTYEYQNWFKQIRPILFIGDIVIGNLETTFSGPPYTGNQYYSAPDEFLRIIKRSGFNVLMNANDKITDFDGYGIVRTLNKLDEVGVRHTGAFRSSREKEINYPLMLNVHNIRVAVLNYTAQVKKQVYTEEVFNKLSLSQIKKDIATAKSKGAEYILVYMHWGNEYDPKVLDYQKTIANSCVEYGADAIVGSNSHIFQPVEIREVKRNDKPSKAIVAYSLGDFLPASNDPLVNNSAILEIMLKKHKTTGEVIIEDFGYIPIWTQIENKNFTVLPITNIDENEIMNIKLNYKQYTDAKTAMNTMRGTMFEKMEEIHYNLSDKIVEDVDQTFLLQKDNPSLAKVAEKTFKDSLSKSQIAYIELFGTKEEKEKLHERNKSAKEVEDARIMAFKNQIRKKELMRKSQEEIVAQFNTPVFEKKTIRPQEETENIPVRLPSKYVKVPKPKMQIMEIDRSETLYTMSAKNKTNSLTVTEAKLPVINTARNNNFQDYPKTSVASNINEKSPTASREVSNKLTNEPLALNSTAKNNNLNTQTLSNTNSLNNNETNKIQSPSTSGNNSNTIQNTSSTESSKTLVANNAAAPKVTANTNTTQLNSAPNNAASQTATNQNNTTNNINNNSGSINKEVTIDRIKTSEVTFINQDNKKVNDKNVNSEVTAESKKASQSTETISGQQQKTNSNQTVTGAVAVKESISQNNQPSNNWAVSNPVSNLNLNNSENNVPINNITTKNETSKEIINQSSDKVKPSEIAISNNKTGTTASESSAITNRTSGAQADNETKTRSTITQNTESALNTKSSLSANTINTKIQDTIHPYESDLIENDLVFSEVTTPKKTDKNKLSVTKSTASNYTSPATTNSKNNLTTSTGTSVSSDNKPIKLKTDISASSEIKKNEVIVNNTKTEIEKSNPGNINKTEKLNPTVPLSVAYNTINSSGNTSIATSTGRTTKVVSQVVDSSGKVQTVIRRLEVVTNKPTANLPYRPKTGGGIFTASEPTAPSTTNLKGIPTAPPATQVIKTTIEEEVIYYVQVYAFTEKYNIDTDQNPSLKYYEVVIEENQYKYLVGKSKNMIQVAKLCEELREKGYADAFMVKYVNGKRVPFVGN